MGEKSLNGYYRRRQSIIPRFLLTCHVIRATSSCSDTGGDHPRQMGLCVRLMLYQYHRLLPAVTAVFELLHRDLALVTGGQAARVQAVCGNVCVVRSPCHRHGRPPGAPAFLKTGEARVTPTVPRRYCARPPPNSACQHDGVTPPFVAWRGLRTRRRRCRLHVHRRRAWGRLMTPLHVLRVARISSTHAQCVALNALDDRRSAAHAMVRGERACSNSGAHSRRRPRRPKADATRRLQTGLAANSATLMTVISTPPTVLPALVHAAYCVCIASNKACTEKCALARSTVNGSQVPRSLNRFLLPTAIPRVT